MKVIVLLLLMIICILCSIYFKYFVFYYKRLLYLLSYKLNKPYKISRENIKSTKVIGLEKQMSALKLAIAMGSSVLICGIEGTGKTLIAYDLDGEPGKTLLYINARNLRYNERNKKVIREMFNYAKYIYPCIVFIDNIDYLDNRFIDIVLDGADRIREIYDVTFIVSSSQIAVFDKYKMFKQKIELNLPNPKSRYEMLKFYMDEFRLSYDMDLHDISSCTTNCTGKEIYSTIENLERNSKNKFVTKKDILSTMVEVLFISRSKVYRSEERMMHSAYHEVGHAIVALKLIGKGYINEVSLLGKEDASAYVSYNGRILKDKRSKCDSLYQIAVGMAGRAAEKMFFGDDLGTTEGIQGDLKKCTDIALEYIFRFGFDEEFLLVSLIDEKKELKLNLEYMKEVSRIIKECEKMAREILESNKENIEVVVKKLIEVEVITGEEFENLVHLN